MLFLVNDKSQVALSPERGAIITSLQVADREILYLDQATFDDPSKNVRGGVPVLFPICGPLAEADYEWEDKRYSLKQHGFARNLPWTVKEQDPQSVTLELSDTEATRQQYPFAFRYTLRYTALPEGVRIDQTITNRGNSAMPAQFGFHPYFAVGAKERLRFDLPVSEYSDNKSDARGPYPGLDFSSQEIDWAFPHPSARSASLEDPDRKIRVSVDYGGVYEVLVFWTLQDSPFVCLEPWSSSRLAFPDGSDVHRVGPGESLITSVEIKVEDIV